MSNLLLFPYSGCHMLDSLCTPYSSSLSSGLAVSFQQQVLYQSSGSWSFIGLVRSFHQGVSFLVCFGLILQVSQLKVHSISSVLIIQLVEITMPVCDLVLHIGLLKSVEVHQITLSLGKVPLGLICVDHFGTWTWPSFVY